MSNSNAPSSLDRSTSDRRTSRIGHTAPPELDADVHASMDAAITRVRAGSERWATLSLEARASIIAAVHRSLGSVS